MSKNQSLIIEIECSSCKNLVHTRKGNIQRAIRLGKAYVCKKCVPQRTPDFWKNKERTKKHSNAIKSSKLYYQSLLSRNISGVKNGMFGKKHTDATIAKMSKTRTGKKQKKSTIQKRLRTQGLLPKAKRLNRKVREFIHKKLSWYLKVYQRDSFTCQNCGAKGKGVKLDAHHKIPLGKLIAQLLKGKESLPFKEKYNILIRSNKIRDKKLKNGITLCRKCHKKIHTNWGSHNVQIRK